MKGIDLKKIIQILLFSFALLFCCVLSADDKNFSWLIQNNKIVLNIAKSCYIYADSVNIIALGDDGKKLNLTAPIKTNYTDQVLGDVLIYETGKHIWQAPETIKSAVIDYQGCKVATGRENSICYMPQTINLGDVQPEQKTPEISSENESSLIKLLNNFQVISIREGVFKGNVQIVS